MRAPWAWRRRQLPEPQVVRVYEQPLGVADLSHSDAERRRAAERAWLAKHREHRAKEAADG